MSDPLTAWTVRIILVGFFLVFLAHFGKFVHGEIWPILAPLFRRCRRKDQRRGRNRHSRATPPNIPPAGA